MNGLVRGQFATNRKAPLTLTLSPEDGGEGTGKAGDRKPASCRSGATHYRDGLTLVEVIAGLALMASLLSTMVVAYSAHLRQHRTAQRKVQAVELLDKTLEEWRRIAQPIPVPSEGDFLGKPEFHWRTELVPNSTVQQFFGEVVRIEVREKQEPYRLLCSLELPRPKRVAGGGR